MDTVPVKDIIRQTFFIDPDMTLDEASKKMDEGNCAILPVGTPDNMKGTITDRDLVVLALMNGQHEKRVGDYMTTDVTFCHASDTLADAVNLMQKNKTYFLFVKDSSERVIGKISFGEILKHEASHKKFEKMAQRAANGT